MSSTSSSSQGVVNVYQTQWKQAVEDRAYLPFILPYSVFNYVLLILYLLYSRSIWVEKSRYFVFAAIVWLSISTMADCRTLNLDYGVIIGIMSSWCILWSTTLMIFHTPHRDFCRLVKLSRKASQQTAHEAPAVEDPLRKSNGASENPRSCQQTGHEDYVWEYMPGNFWPRLGWVLDLLTSLRGLHWSWRSSRIPPISTLHAKDTRRRPFQAGLWLMFIYIGLDVLNIIAKTDSYFWGVVDPSESYISASHAYHSFITFLCLLFVNLAIFNGPPLLYIHILGPNIVGTLSEPWMHVTAPGPIQSILDDGLRGFWNSWWHQMFRFALSSPGVWLADRLGISRAFVTIKWLRVIIAFTLSGIIHACGCYTMWPATSSSKLFLSFMLQPVGMVLQDFIALVARILGVNEMSKVSGMMRLCFTVFWLWLTFGLAGDEYARGGMWLVEPVPFSPLRCLGFGPVQQGCWLWYGVSPHLYSGAHWWQTGLAI